MKEQVMYMIVSQNAILIKQKITQFYDTKCSIENE